MESISGTRRTVCARVLTHASLCLFCRTCSLEGWGRSENVGYCAFVWIWLNLSHLFWRWSTQIDKFCEAGIHKIAALCCKSLHYLCPSVQKQYTSSSSPSPSLVLDLCPVITDSPCFPFPLHSPFLLQLLMIMVFFFPPSWVINSHGNTFVTTGRLRWSAQWRFGITEGNKWGRLLHLSVCKYMRVYRQRAWQGRWCILNCLFFSSLLTNVLFLLFCLKPRPLFSPPWFSYLIFLMCSVT